MASRMICVTGMGFLALAAAVAGPGFSQDSTKSLEAAWNDKTAIPTTNVVVEINQQNEIAVDVSGTLVKLDPAARGGMVTKGQIVAEIDNRQAKAELAELEYKAEANFEISYAQQAIDFATNTLEDWQKRNEVNGSDIYGPEEIEKQKLEVIKAEAGMEKALHEKEASRLAAETKRVQLSMYTKKAEISGIVTDLHKKAVGTSIRQGDPIMTIVNFDTMVVKMYVDPRYESRISVGDKVIVRRQMTSSSGVRPRGRNVFEKNDNEDDEVPEASPTEEYYFEGEVTFTGGQAKTDKENSILIEAVVRNRVSGNFNYLLKEGVRINAKIIPQR